MREKGAGYWRLIDKAPRDGTPVLLGFQGTGVCPTVGQWIGFAGTNGGAWDFGGMFDHSKSPTHFMLIPKLEDGYVIAETAAEYAKFFPVTGSLETGLP